MKITCQSCQAKYTIADEKVAGKTVKIKCKKCGATIVVSGADAGGAPAAGAPQLQGYGAPGSAPVLSTSPGDDDEGEGATRVFAEGGPAGGPGADEWTVNVTDEDQRTLTNSQILMEFQRGTITTDTYVWKDGMADWLPIADIPELSRLVSSPRPAAGGAIRPAAGAGPRPAAGIAAPVAPAPAAPIAAAPVGARAAVAPDLGAGGLGGTMIMNEGSPVANLPQEPSPAAFGAAGAPAAARRGGKAAGVDLFGAGQRDNAASASSAAAAASHADRQVGERNENSVLFSISALTAAAGAAKKGDDPFDLGAPAAKNNGRGAVDDFMNLNSGIGGPMLAPPPLLAPVVEAPPPPPPVMAPVAAVAAAPAVSAVPPIQLQAAPPPAKSKAPLVIGLFAVVAIAGGAGAFFALKPAPTPPPTGTESTTKDTGSTGATAAPTTAPTPTQAAAPTADTAKAADTGTPQAATAPASTPVAAGTPNKPAIGGPLPGKTPDAKPDKTPEPPKTPDKTPEPPKTPDKAPEPPKPDTGGSGGKEFDRAAAMSALGASSGAARGCKKDDGPTGTARVKITFAPNGSVTSSSVEGPPFAGTPVGGCIAGAFRGAHVPAFDGGPVTVTKSVSIN